MRQELFIHNERPTSSASDVRSTARPETKTQRQLEMMALSTDSVARSRFWKTGYHIFYVPDFGGAIKIRSFSAQN
jgi:hypothetical protein